MEQTLIAPVADPTAATGESPRLSIAPYSVSAADAISVELGVSYNLAQVLVRRGHTTPADAQAWLAADEHHSPELFDGIGDAVALVLTHVAAGSQITIHGDYDVDGVCSTAIMVRSLQRLGATVDWFLPSRTQDGYGLSLPTVDRLAKRGTRLLITVDCAITAVEEVAAARSAGIDVLVTDHHAPRADGLLPDALIFHPALCGYPCPQLCAASVALKLAEALESRSAPTDGPGWIEDLDLAALATVADCVPLIGENRRIVAEGLCAISSTAKLGLKALMRVAQVDPSALDARAIGFRLAPRLNAAGRLYRADAGLELLMTQDSDRASAIATELDRLNAERRDVETRIRFEAETQARALGPRMSYVLAAQGWHPGVIGIVASRIAELYNRPAIMIALDGEQGTCSGRSIANFDLLEGLRAGSEHLIRHGGHRAAAGATIASDQVEAFREAFEAYALANLSAEDLIGYERVDAVVGGGVLGMEFAQELTRLAPYGIDNPEPTLLIRGATLHDPRAMGEGKHLRFTLHSDQFSARAVAFGVAGGKLPVAAGDPADVTVRLDINHWNGSVEPQLILGSARPSNPTAINTFSAELEADYLAVAFAELDAILERRPEPADRPKRKVVDRRGGGVTGVIADLVAAGDSLLAVCHDTANSLVDLSGHIGGFTLCSYAFLETDQSVADAYEHVVGIEPPICVDQALLLKAGSAGSCVHAWGKAEIQSTQRIFELQSDFRTQLAGLYRSLRDSSSTDGGGLEDLLQGDHRQSRPPQLAGRLLRVLIELNLVTLDRESLEISVPPSPHTELDQSAAFRAYKARYEDGQRFLSQATAQAA
ncbi:MAG: single-stranded-DNA-specific exonuclease RecJ [Actinomycetota bacterium]